MHVIGLTVFNTRGYTYGDPERTQPSNYSQSSGTAEISWFTHANFVLFLLIYC